MKVPPSAAEFGRQVAALRWVTDLLVGGSLATGDYQPGVSDLDLVAFTDGPIDWARRTTLLTLHRNLDDGPARGAKLGCVYVDPALVSDLDAKHPTWTHGSLVDRPLSLITRAELTRHGYAMFGRAPLELLPAMTDDQVRAAARAELTGYWAWAARRPLMWLDPELADLGLTAMARGRHAMRTGQLLSKTEAIGQLAAPAWLVAQVRSRRAGQPVRSPRLRTGLIAWQDARRTVESAKHRG